MSDYTGGSTGRMQLLEFFIGLSLNFDFLRIPTGDALQGRLIGPSGITAGFSTKVVLAESSP